MDETEAAALNAARVQREDARWKVRNAGPWGLLLVAKATPEESLRAKRAALALSVKTEMAKLNAELKALRGSNDVVRARTRTTAEEAKASRDAHALARKRMAVAAAKENAVKLQAREAKAARLAALVAEKNDKTRAIIRSVAQTRLAASVNPISERWQPRPETTRYRNF